MIRNWGRRSQPVDCRVPLPRSGQRGGGARHPGRDPQRGGSRPGL